MTLGGHGHTDSCVDLGDAPGRANAGDKLLTLVASALAGGECIDDADALRAGGTASVLACTVKASSTLGTFLRSFRWGHVRQLDRVTRKLLARAWAVGAAPARVRSLRCCCIATCPSPRCTPRSMQWCESARWTPHGSPSRLAASATAAGRLPPWRARGDPRSCPTAAEPRGPLGCKSTGAVQTAPEVVRSEDILRT